MPDAWLSYICALRGHVVNGIGVGTGPDDVVWDSHCARCGAPQGLGRREP